ncbi:MAG: hypothetical protein AAGI91_11910 [Bacteroidota bacterium]
MTTHQPSERRTLEQIAEAIRARSAAAPEPRGGFGEAHTIWDDDLDQMHQWLRERIRKNQERGWDLGLEQSRLWLLSGQVEEKARMYTVAKESYELAAMGVDMFIERSVRAGLGAGREAAAVKREAEAAAERVASPCRSLASPEPSPADGA